MVHVGRRVKPATVTSDCSSSSSNSQCPESSEEETETFVEWMERATKISEGHVRAAGVLDWVEAQRRFKYRLAGHLARREDGRWSTKVSRWVPIGGRRGVGQPKSRRADDCDDFDGSWYDMAHCSLVWHQAETASFRR